MKTIIQIILISLLSVSLLEAVAFTKVVKSRSAEVTITSDKPLTPGANIISLHVSDKKYHDAAVSVKFFMPAMPGMPYMQTLSDAKNLGNGKFTTNINLSMGGTWQIHIFIKPKTGKKVRLKTSVNI